MFKVNFILAVIIILCSYLYFTDPDGIAISKEGRIEGLCNKGREVLQNGKFWKFQLERANEKYNKNYPPSESMSSIMQEHDKFILEIQKDADDNSKGIYTPEEQIAKSLRRKADSLEKEGRYREIDETNEKYRLKTIEKLKIIIPIIEVKLHDSKPSYTPIFLLLGVLVFASLVAISKYQKILAGKNQNATEYYNSDFDDRYFQNNKGTFNKVSEWLEHKLMLIFLMGLFFWLPIFLFMFIVSVAFVNQISFWIEDITVLSIISTSVVFIFVYYMDKSENK